METRIWADIFQLGVPLAEKILRPAIIYVFLVVGLRLAGKRELAQLNPFDFIVLLTLSNTVQNAIIGNDNSVTGGMIGAAALLLINYGVVSFLYRHQRLERLVVGEPRILIEGGKVRRDELKREHITMTELAIAARKQGFDSLEDIEQAELEPSGGLSFIRQPLLPEVVRHREVMSAFQDLKAELAALRAGRI